MAAILDFQDGHHSKPNFAITPKLNMIERQTQRLYLCYWSANPMKLHLEFQDGGHLEFSRWPLFKPNFAHNSKTKHDRKAKSKATPRFLGSTSPLKLFSEFQVASPSQHGIAESARAP